MLARSNDNEDWRTLLATAVTDGRELLRRLGLLDHPLAERLLPRPDFPVRVPAPYLACMRHGDAEDPLLRQVLATAAETEQVPGFSADPLRENGQNPLPGLLHKYHGRALLIAAGSCAVNCRYCFRRHFPYGENNPGRRGLEPALNYLRDHGDIQEVILSGGDPLMLDDDALGWLIARLEQIPHLRRLRIHTRFPLVIPQRLTTEFSRLLSMTRLRSVMVLHINHPQELGTGIIEAIEPLRRQGIPLFNQTVLLAGVNDDVDTLAALCEQSFDAGIQPYYLHLLDRVAGAAHFDLPEVRARALYDELAARMPGYLLPRLVRERAGAPGKVAMAPRWQADAVDASDLPDNGAAAERE